MSNFSHSPSLLNNSNIAITVLALNSTVEAEQSLFSLPGLEGSDSLPPVFLFGVLPSLCYNLSHQSYAGVLLPPVFSETQLYVFTGSTQTVLKTSQLTFCLLLQNFIARIFLFTSVTKLINALLVCQCCEVKGVRSEATGRTEVKCV